MDLMQPLEAVGPEGRSCLGWAVIWVIRLLLPLLAATTLWNVLGALHLDEIDDDYVVRIGRGSVVKGEEADSRGAELVARWLATRAQPSWNPLRILWHQLRFNAFTSSYRQVMWVEPGDGDLDRRRFALYQVGSTVFLRLEFDGKNRVLVASFTADELDAALEPFLFDPGKPAETPLDGPR